MKLKASVYKKAAERIAVYPKGPIDSYFACYAIGKALGIPNTEGPSDHEVLYAKYFKPTSKHIGDPWYGDALCDEHQEARRLSLLFMAEFVKELK